MEVESKQQVLKRRKEIEEELLTMLKETKSDFTLKDIKDAIYQEEETDDMMKVVAMFDRGGGAAELENALDLVTDAWNYFPHKTLGGISPSEKMTEHHGKEWNSSRGV
jgi:Ran GTPase-activating protein (RanGAP) involved in mRNA processing and transport